MRKLIIGITGTFGCGKTTAAKMLSKKAKIIDADILAKRLARKEKIRKRIFRQFKTSERKQLARIVFSDHKKLKRLEAILHPEVRKEIKMIIKNSRKHVIIDAPLLVEGKFLSLLDYLIVVACDPEKRRNRLIKKGFSEQEIAARARFQLPEEKKISQADIVIDNSASRKQTKKQVDIAWKRITKLM